MKLTHGFMTVVVLIILVIASILLLTIMKGLRATGIISK